MATGQFQIVLPLAYSTSTSAEEWKRAMAVPGSELPSLSVQQKEIARKFNIPEEEYARNVLAGSYGWEKTRKRASDLGEAVQAAIRALDVGYRVTAVIRDINRLGWVVRIETPSGDLNVLVSKELADGLLDSGSESEKEQLRVRILSSLEQAKLRPYD
jgi:hypothetical protein